MKTRVFSGLEREQLIRSVIYIVVAVTMVASSFPAGVLKGNGLGVLLSNIGLIIFFFALLRPWANAKYYFIQFAILFVIFSILQLIRIIFKLELSEDSMWLAGGVCIDAFISSIIGIIAFAEGLRCTLYSAANVALLAIFIMFPQTLSPDPELSKPEVICAGISLIFQFASVAIFFLIASSFDGKVGRFNRNMILVSGIVLILMGVWAIIEFDVTDWMFGIRIWSALEFISGLTALYAYGISNMAEGHAE